MEDLFYFPPEPISVDDIAGVARDAGLTSQTHPPDDLTIYYSDDNFWSWQELHDDGGADMVGFEEADRATMAALGYAKVFAVSFRPASLPKLCEFLAILLQRYGGWIGSDSEGLYPIFTAANIADLAHQRIGYRPISG
jgi:hypothetical protein